MLDGVQLCYILEGQYVFGEGWGKLILLHVLLSNIVLLPKIRP